MANAQLQEIIAAMISVSDYDILLTISNREIRDSSASFNDVLRTQPDEMIDEQESEIDID